MELKSFFYRYRTNPIYLEAHSCVKEIWWMKGNSFLSVTVDKSALFIIGWVVISDNTSEALSEPLDWRTSSHVPHSLWSSDHSKRFSLLSLFSPRLLSFISNTVCAPFIFVREKTFFSFAFFNCFLKVREILVADICLCQHDYTILELLQSSV